MAPPRTKDPVFRADRLKNRDHLFLVSAVEMNGCRDVCGVELRGNILLKGNKIFLGHESNWFLCFFRLVVNDLTAVRFKFNRYMDQLVQALPHGFLVAGGNHEEKKSAASGT